MKSYCKGINIKDRYLVECSVYDCLRGKWTRNDTLHWFLRYSDCKTMKEMKAFVLSGNAEGMKAIVDSAIDDIVTELTKRKLELKPIWYSTKYDNCCHKNREIGIQDVKQQCYDYIAVYAMKDIFRRIGEYQCASLPGRGQSYGIRAVKRWLRNPDIKYALKADVQKCFPSISHENMMAFLRRYIRNDDLLWLVDELLGTFKHGLSIGSYLSQYLCNLYLSQLYHFIEEECFAERVEKKFGTVSRTPMVSHVLFYMDDILLLGKNAKYLNMAQRRIRAKLEEMGLVLKPDWRVWKLDDKQFIDIMGARIYRHHITIRRKVFVRIRRAIKTARIVIDTHKRMTRNLAYRVVAYYGVLRHTNSYGLAYKYFLYRSIRVAKGITRDEGKIRQSTAPGYYQNAGRYQLHYHRLEPCAEA